MRFGEGARALGSTELVGVEEVDGGVTASKIKTSLARSPRLGQLLHKRAKGGDARARPDHEDWRRRVAWQSKGRGAHEDDDALTEGEGAELCGAHALFETSLGCECERVSAPLRGSRSTLTVMATRAPLEGMGEDEMV